MGNDNQIGLSGAIPFKSDLDRFKLLTLGKTLVMGRKTFESIGKKLEGREVIVITNKEAYNPEHVWVAKTKEQAVGLARFMQSTELMVCGGAKIYQDFMDVADRAYLTFVDYDGEADTYFPSLSGEWSISYQENTEEDQFHILDRIKIRL